MSRTPGPLRAIHGEKTQVLRPDGHPIATIHSTRADAELFAAAPDLLESAKFLLSQVEKLAEFAFAEAEGVKEWLEKNDAVNCAKRAIAKAEGK